MRRGSTRALAIGNQPLGTTFNLTLSQDIPIRLLSLRGTYQSNAAGGSGQQLEFNLIDPNGVIPWHVGAVDTFAGTQSKTFQISPVFSQEVEYPDTPSPYDSVPWIDFWMPPGWTIQGTCPAGTAADQWLGLTALVQYGNDFYDEDRMRAAIDAAYQALAGN